MAVNIFESANILVDEMTRVSNLLVSVNSSVNFVIYCIFGDKFQRLFLRYFCCCCRMRWRPQSGTLTFSIGACTWLIQLNVLLFSGRSSPDNPDNSVSMPNTAEIHRVSMFSNRSNIPSGKCSYKKRSYFSIYFVLLSKLSPIRKGYP